MTQESKVRSIRDCLTIEHLPFSLCLEVIHKQCKKYIILENGLNHATAWGKSTATREMYVQAVMHVHVLSEPVFAWSVS